MRFIFLLLFSFISANTFSQSYTQTFRCSVADNQVQQPLIGANVIVLNTNPLLGTTSDERGNFRIDHVPVGTYNIQVTYIGYEPKIIPNVIISSGKETILAIEMKESVIEGQEV